MKANWMWVNGVSVFGYLTFGALSVLALALPRATPPLRITSAGHTYLLPAEADASHTLLSDGRVLEVHGAEGVVYLTGEGAHAEVALPEKRRFASITAMPGGQVLIWGGIDGNGEVIDSGEWFNPKTLHFVRTGALGLPARAGHTLSLLTDGSLLMTGGWSADGTPATDVVVWESMSREVRTLSENNTDVRLAGSAQLLADGSVRIEGGVDGQGKALSSAREFAPVLLSHAPPIEQARSHLTGISDSIPAKDSKAASIHGPLVLHFAAPVDLKQLSAKTVTLLGPEGTVSVHVVGAEGGRLAFVQLPDDLYPGSRYTLFVKGLHTAKGADLPFAAIGFTTASTGESGVVVAGQGERPAQDAQDPPSSEHPLYLMAGGGVASCQSDQPCRRNSFIQDGAWYPGENNVPDTTGAHWRLYTSYQSLPDTRSLESALPKDTTALVGQVRQIDETPVVNVEVSIGGQKTRTDARGVFVLSNLPTGRQEVFVDGGSASHDKVHYGRFLVGADLKAKSINHLPFVMYLPRVLPRDEITLPAPTTREVVLTHPDMPGLELHIPAGAVFKDREGHVLTHIALVPTPVDHAPFPLPDNFPMYFTIQPGDAVIQGLTPAAARGIRVVYPNYAHDKPNTASDFWVYSIRDGWQMYGRGHVTPDAKHLAPDPGVTLAWALGAGASQNGVNPPTGRKVCTTIVGQPAVVGQPVDLQTGILFHEWNDFDIRDVIPLTLTRGYTSADINSHAFGIGGNSNFGIHLYSSADTTGNGNVFTTPQLVLPCGEGIAFNLVSGSAAWPFPAGTVWEHTSTNSPYYGATLQFLYDTTSDGAHWIVNMKDGTQYAFTRHIPNSLAWMQDRYGNKIRFNYNGGLVSQMLSPSGRSITLNYDSGNRVTSAVDNSGRAIGYAYNGAGSLATVTYPDQTTEQFTYDGSHRMLTMQDRRGTVWVSNQYDTAGRVVKQIYSDSTYYAFAYSAASNGSITATTVTDPNGNQEQVVFDTVSGYPSSDTRAYGTPLAQTTTFVREPSGLIDSTTDVLGRTTTFTYDGLGNVLSLTRLTGTSNAVTTRFTYTPAFSQLATVTDPLGHVTTYGYNNGCLTSITNALGNVIRLQCNSAGQPVALKDPLGNTTIFAYQGYDLQSTTDPLDRTVGFTVDNLGREIGTRDPLGNVELKTFDTNDRVVSRVDALNLATTVGYDGNGNVLSVTLPNQGVVSATYDGRNRKTTRTDALNQSESWTYDGLDNVLVHKDRKGQVTDFSYDALNRRSLTAYADGSGIQASYDAASRLTSLTDSAFGTMSWSYDDLDRVTAEVSGQGNVSYAYDAAGRRTSMTPAAQAIVNYGYDNANRLTSINQGSESVQVVYDAKDRRTTLTLPNGVVVNYGYDSASELTSLGYTQSNGSILGGLSYSYDSDGRRASQNGSLASGILPTSTAQAASVDLNGRKFSFSGQTLSYDANGNLISDGTNTYSWNARNQLTQINQGSNMQLAYSYDAVGRRVSKTVQGGTPTQYLYDELNAVQETQGSIINPILTGLGIDERFARNDVTGRTYFLIDALNSTIALTDPTGAISERYSYDPYGNVAPSDITTGFTNPYQYTGREADSPGLYYYRARYYSPVMGGFISEDPIGFDGGQNSFYAYVGGNPLDYLDPLGLCPIDPSPAGDGPTGEKNPLSPPKWCPMPNPMKPLLPKPGANEPLSDCRDQAIEHEKECMTKCPGPGAKAACINAWDRELQKCADHVIGY